MALHACSGVEASEKETVKATVETFDGVFAWKAIGERSKLRLSYEDAASFVGVGRQARNTTGSSAFSYISHQRHLAFGPETSKETCRIGIGKQEEGESVSAPSKRLRRGLGGG